MNGMAWRGVGVAALVVVAGCGVTLDIDAVSQDPPPTDEAPSVPEASPTPTPERVVAEPTPTEATATEPTPTEADAATEVGQCYTAEQLGLVGAQTVSCTEPHVAEIFATNLLREPADAPWPTLDVLQAESSVFCNEAFGEATGVPGDISAIDVKFFRPDEGSWERGDREVACFVEYPDPVDVPLTALDPLRAFGQVSSYGLSDGDCVIDDTLTDVVSLTLVDCVQRHSYEVYASLVLDDEAYPGEESIMATADDFCAEQFARFVGIAYSDSVLLVENLWPTEQSWSSWGDRLVTCAITTTNPREGSARGAGI